MKIIYTGSPGNVKMLAYSGKILVGQILLVEKYSYDQFLYKAEMLCISSNDIFLLSLEDCQNWIKEQFSNWLTLANLQEKDQ